MVARRRRRWTRWHQHHPQADLDLPSRVTPTLPTWALTSSSVSSRLFVKHRRSRRATRPRATSIISTLRLLGGVATRSWSKRLPHRSCPRARTTLVNASRAVRARRLRGRGHGGAPAGPDGNIWFLEVNPRLQVEHPVSEEVLALTWCASRLVSHCGPAAHHSSEPRGHSFEFRVTPRTCRRI